MGLGHHSSVAEIPRGEAVLEERAFTDRIDVIDSHTGGEPTRVVTAGWPMPAGDTMSDRLSYCRAHQDHLRQAVLREPRGHDAIVGALMTPPVNEGAMAGVIFMNDVGYLGMCCHGFIGVVETLRFLGKIELGDTVTIDTPPGSVTATIDMDGFVSLANVSGYLHKSDVSVDVPGFGNVTGDIAYAGNWFFMVSDRSFELRLANTDTLMVASKAIRRALIDAGISGVDGAVIDHIEFYGQPTLAGADSKNFVLCPGNAYDRSPCGTGMSAKMVALHAKGKLEMGQIWKQESITGSVFEGWLTLEKGKIIPHIKARAYVVSQASLMLDQDDPICWGIQ